MSAILHYFRKKKCRACCWISRKRYALSDLETLNSKNSVYYHHVILLLTCDVLIKVFSVDNILLKIIKLITGNQIDCSPELARLGMLTRTHTHTESNQDDVIMGTIASLITSLTIVYSTVYSDADQRKHQSSASLAFVWGIHRDRWIPHTNGQ